MCASLAGDLLQQQKIVAKMNFNRSLRRSFHIKTYLHKVTAIQHRRSCDMIVANCCQLHNIQTIIHTNTQQSSQSICADHNKNNKQQITANSTAKKKW